MKVCFKKSIDKLFDVLNQVSLLSLVWSNNGRQRK